MHFARFQNDRFVKRFVIPTIAFTNENPQQHRSAWNFHSQKKLTLIEQHREIIPEPDCEKTKHKRSDRVEHRKELLAVTRESKCLQTERGKRGVTAEHAGHKKINHAKALRGFRQSQMKSAKAGRLR